MQLHCTYVTLPNRLSITNTYKYLFIYLIFLYYSCKISDFIITYHKYVVSSKITDKKLTPDKLFVTPNRTWLSTFFEQKN